MAAEPLLDESVLAEWRALGVPGEPDPAQELVDLFVALAPGRLDSLRRAVASADLARVREAAHLLRGSAGSVGARRLEAAAAQLEELPAVDWRLTAEQLLVGLDAHFTQAAAALKQLAARSSEP